MQHPDGGHAERLRGKPSKSRGPAGWERGRPQVPIIGPRQEEKDRHLGRKDPRGLVVQSQRFATARSFQLRGRRQRPDCHLFQGVEWRSRGLLPNRTLRAFPLRTRVSSPISQPKRYRPRGAAISPLRGRPGPGRTVGGPPGRWPLETRGTHHPRSDDDPECRQTQPSVSRGEKATALEDISETAWAVVSAEQEVAPGVSTGVVTEASGAQGKKGQSTSGPRFVFLT